MGWANKLVGWTNNTGAEVNGDGSLYTVDVSPTGSNYVVASKTGVIAAAAAAGATVFAMRFDPSAGTKSVWIDSIRLRWTTIVAFTVPVTQTRSLVLTRGSGAAASGGTAIPVTNRKDSNYPVSEFDSAVGGDIRIASTGALTVTGITFETINLFEVPLIHMGAAGAFYETVYEFGVRSHPIELHAGELIALRVGSSAMDAAGTWSLSVDVSWRESISEA